MDQIAKEIQQIGIVPVVVLEDAKDARPLAEVLCRGGLPCAEVTFRTAAAAESIRVMTSEFPDMLVGAGTVLTVTQVDEALAAGARFIVSPGLNPKVVSYCLEKGVSVIPGTTNPSDVEQAMELGLEVVKFFPAEAAGGLKMIKSMAAPYYQMHFMPTGGINADNLAQYLGFPKILACGGSWMVASKLIQDKNFAEIERLTREAVLAMLDFQLQHVGVNCDSDEAAVQSAEHFAGLFGMNAHRNEKSIFAGDMLEVMKQPGRGAFGHIAIGTTSVERAKHYLKSTGVAFLEDSCVYEGDTLVAVYLEEEVAGMAIHLVRRS